MKDLLTAKNIFIAALIGVVLFLTLCQGGGDNVEIDISKDKVEKAESKKIELRQGIKDTLAQYPVLEQRVDSLLAVLKDRDKKFKQINKQHAKVIRDIDDNTVDDDIKLYSEYLSSREGDFRK